MGKAVLGIDLGASKARFGLVAGNGLLKGDIYVKELPPEPDNDKLADFLKQEIAQLLKGKNRLAVCAIGLGSPGPLDPFYGIIESPPNLPKVKNLRVANLLKKKFGIPVFLLNDADAAVLGETWIGAGKGFNEVVMLTLGTGIGSGVVASGRLQRGRSKGGEWGHTTIAGDHQSTQFCACGEENCLEAYVGTAGLYKIYCDTFELSNANQLKSMLPQDKVAFALARGLEDKDTRWEYVLKRYAYFLAQGIRNIVLVHHPECIILGGGIAKIGNHLLEALFVQLHKRKDKMSNLLNGLEIKLAKLSNAGVVGAGKYALDCLKEE